MSHIDPDRFALIATGEDPTAPEQRHVDDCLDCAIELAELERTVAIGRSTAALGDLESPPERVWDRIVEDVRAVRDEEAMAAARPPRAAGDGRRERRRRRIRPRPGASKRLLFTFAVAAAAMFVVAGIWGAVRPAQVVEFASATLDAFPDHAGAEGRATVIEAPGGELEVRVELDSAAPEDGHREVWLITADASAILSLGVLDGSEGVFSVPADIDLHEFVLVDISYEPDDGDPEHSGDSVVRGELQFA